MKVFVAVLIVYIAMTVSVFGYEKIIELSLPAIDIEELEIDCGSGFLKVTNDENVQQIKVTAEIIVLSFHLIQPR